MKNDYRFFATTALRLELLLAEEINRLGGGDVSESRAGVKFHAGLETAYRICLHSRVANRVLLVLAKFPSSTTDELYENVKNIDWDDHLGPDATFAVDVTLRHTKIGHSKFAALKVKDAVVDQFRDRFGSRPSIDLERPDIRLNVHIDQDIAQLSLDLSGESLHRRGYRAFGGEAPLKENLAAAILLRAKWPAISQAGGGFIDPMCGSGTLAIEAALMAGDIAPGLIRDYFGFSGWKQHDAETWKMLIQEAETRRQLGIKNLPPIYGYDQDKRVVKSAWINVERAGLQGLVHIEKKNAGDVRPLQAFKGMPGLIAANPPYGVRLGESKEVSILHKEFGETLRQHFIGWKAAVFTANSELGFQLGIRSRKPYTFFNGAMECKLLILDIGPERFFEPKSFVENETHSEMILRKAWRQSHGAGMFANRVKKNIRNLNRWARRENINCYRIYDADLPEYALAIDLYQGDEKWVNIQEYSAPASIDPQKAEARLIAAISEIPKILEVPQERIFLKIRKRQKGRNQYNKLLAKGHFFAVQEGQCKFWINLQDYLDTGLFLDHRITRGIIWENAKGKRFLNLFGYTGSATVYAALGGAKTTTTVDLSGTYLEWARRNLELNGLSGANHALIEADCLEWIEQSVQNAWNRSKYDLIFLDPPTFSNSKNRVEDFEIQRDHVDLINALSKLLAADGLLLFSTNYRKFKLDSIRLKGLCAEDISASTIPKDFARTPKIHFCWKIRFCPEGSDTGTGSSGEIL